jgi:hypothetical protein
LFLSCFCSPVCVVHCYRSNLTHASKRLYHGADLHNVTHTSSGKSFQLSFVPFHRDDTQIFFDSCVVSIVDHGSYRKTQATLEFPTGEPTASSL